MKTLTYNPSELEVEFASAIEDLKSTIEAKLSAQIIKIVKKDQEDNPVLTFHLEDEDGDPHEVVLKIIQKPDDF